MAQDIGSAILAGVQGVQALSQQRASNRLARDRLAQEERRLGLLGRQVQVEEDTNKRAADEAARLDVIRGNDQFVQAWNAAGLLAPNMLEINGDALRKGIESGNRTAIQFGLDLVNRSGELPEGSVAEAIQPLPEGGYAITVRNKDGSRGAVTVDGSSEPDSEVVRFEAGKLANLGNLYYQTEVVSNSSLISPTIYRAQEGRVKADAERNEIIDRIARRKAVLEALPREGGARRAAANALASASSVEEEEQILSALESDVFNTSPTQTARPAASSSAPTATQSSEPSPPPVASSPSVSSAIPQLNQRAYERAKADPAALQAVGNGFNKNELISLYAYSLRLGDVDTAARLEPYLMRRHDVSQSELGGIKDQIANVRREAGDNMNIPAAVMDAAANTAAEVGTALGFGERAAQERANRAATILSEIRNGTPPAATEQPVSIAVTDPNARAEIRSITESISGRSASEVDRDINAGRISVSPATATAVAADLRSKGITSVEGLLQLNDRHRALARAVIIATEKDPNIRKQMSEEMSNIFETGDVSLSRQEFEQQEIDRDRNAIARDRNSIDRATLNVRMAELRRNLFKDGMERTDKAIDLGAQFIEGTNKIFFGEDGTERNLDRATAARFTNSIMGPYMYRALRSQTKAEGQAALSAMSPALSVTVAALAAEEEGGFVETLVSFFRADAVDAFSSTDFDLARVRVEKKNGRPVRFYYTDERGAPLDEAVDAKALQDLNGQVYKLVLDAAEYNSQGG